MDTKIEGAGARACWFVGATYGGTDDQLPRFLEQGLWENGYTDKYLEVVKSIQVGDRIAIKSSYTRRKELPFNNRGHFVSVMGIKAIGVVTENVGDGRILGVEWTPVTPRREWYFYTSRSTVWRVLPGDWMTDALIGFAFDGKTQNLKRFCNAPYWRERFGDNVESDPRFIWTKFYGSVADNLLRFKDDRTELVAGIHDMAARVNGMSNLNDQFKDGSSRPLRDICPFTAMGIFNRGITDSNRKIIAGEFAQFLGVEEPVPESFEGIPILNNQKSWFFGFDKKRLPDDINLLWEIFAEAIRFADFGDIENRSAFVAAYDRAADCHGVGWNLTMGLYWVRPWCFPTLESQSQRYITKKLNIQIGMNGSKGRCSAGDYLEVLETLETRFKEDAYPVHSFPELSLAAWMLPPDEDQDEEKNWRTSILAKIDLLCMEKNSSEFTRQEFLEKNLADLQQEHPNNGAIEDTVSSSFQMLRDDGLLEFLSRGNYKRLEGDEDPSVEEVVQPTPPIIPYSIDDIIAAGCFISQGRLEKILERLRTKKNLILQGPPGTGKTWLGKRLAFALMGQRNDNRVRAVQFHPNLSYEDFVRGWRPAGDGRLALVDGPFLEMVKAAGKQPANRHVIIIEEINRGNPAQIFGEMLTLLEADKRTPNEALELCYRREDGERVFIPDNLYVIGTMNIADRSLALVDLALRRRFAFIDLEPMLNSTWHDWVHDQFDIDPAILTEIATRVKLLNDKISTDNNLGPQFRVGHSYVTPPSGATINDAREWFRQVVDSEIGALLDEYWFDDPKKAQKAREQLLEGF